MMELITHTFHVELSGGLRFLEGRVNIRAVLDLLHGYAQVSAQHVMEGAFFNRDDLGIIRAAEGLNGTLETSDAKGKDAKVQQSLQCQCIKANAEITEDTDFDYDY